MLDVEWDILKGETRKKIEKKGRGKTSKRKQHTKMGAPGGIKTWFSLAHAKSCGVFKEQGGREECARRSHTPYAGRSKSPWKNDRHGRSKRGAGL